MNSIIIIAIAFVLLIPIMVFAQSNEINSKCGPGTTFDTKTNGCIVIPNVSVSTSSSEPPESELSSDWVINIPTEPVPNIEPEKWTWGYESNLEGVVKIGGVHMWTDKDYYAKDETVTVNGKFAPSYQSLIEKGKLDSLPLELSVVAHMKTKNPGIYPAMELGKIKVNDDGTFSFSFPLTGENYPDDSDLLTSEIHILASGAAYFRYFVELKEIPTDHKNSSRAIMTEFFVGNAKAEFEQFEIWIDKDSKRVGITIDEKFEEYYSAATGNDLPIRRITLPSGMILTSVGPYSLSEGQDFSKELSRGGYGDYEFQVSYAGNVVSIKEEFPKPEPRIYVTIEDYPYENKKSCQCFFQGQEIKITANVVDADPKKPYFSYRLVDPENNIIFSNTEYFDKVRGLDFRGIHYHAFGLQWYTPFIIETNSFPNISGKYTFEVNYDGKISGETFDFISNSEKSEEILQESKIIIENKENEISESATICGTGTELVDGICQVVATDVICGTGTILKDNLCVPDPNYKYTKSSKDNGFIDLKKLIPNEFQYDEHRYTQHEDTKNIDGIITKNGEIYNISIIQTLDESSMDNLWNSFKNLRSTMKYPEDTTNLSATCFQGWMNEQKRMSMCIKEEFVVMIASDRDTLPVMKQIIDKIDEIVLLSKITEIKSPNGGGCLIATATYGTELAPQVQQLRELRDNQLLTTESGISFMNTFNEFYYSFSPIIADYERENPIFKEMVKVAITPMITSLSILNYVDMDSEAEVLGYGISLILLNVAMYVGIPASVIVGIRRI